MKNANFILALAFTLVCMLFSSCAAVAGIFEAGMGVGIFIVILIIVVVVVLVIRGRRGP